MDMDRLQIIPIMALAAYFAYMTYYYAAPTFWLKVMLFYAHIKYRDSEIRFCNGKITFKQEYRGEELLMERRLEADPTSRFFAMAVCTEFRAMLRELRTGVPASEETAIELSTGNRTDGAESGKAEDDRD